MARKFFIGGNWKCNGTLEEVKKIVSMLNEAEIPSENVVEVFVSPPFVFLPLVESLLRPDFQVAAQNCWVRKGGAFTGEISAEMLVNLGIPCVILGHSERRSLLNESDEFVGDKVAYALSVGLKVIACIGETLQQRESGSTMAVVAAQTKAIAEKVSNWANVVLAYEPVWAIGTGKVATPGQAQEVSLKLTQLSSQDLITRTLHWHACYTRAPVFKLDSVIDNFCLCENAISTTISCQLYLYHLILFS
ncbi:TRIOSEPHOSPHATE ISOMERASE [Salix purpurea]|uniref:TRIOSEPHOSPHATE ISOMERASE n=1 Tax=Salix purpurea TaxID=77065 RepID=A0A9Q0VV43_SALPP|nr:TRIOSEPHOSPHATE ISOMERASE [Salix purpurea]